MSKLARTALAAALAATALVVPVTADAATRAVVEIAYTKTSSGWDTECRAQAIVVGGVAQVPTCYVSTASGSVQLCFDMRIVNVTGFTSFYAPLRCEAPNVDVPGVGGAGVYRR